MRFPYTRCLGLTHSSLVVVLLGQSCAAHLLNAANAQNAPTSVAAAIASVTALSRPASAELALTDPECQTYLLQVHQQIERMPHVEEGSSSYASRLGRMIGHVQAGPITGGVAAWVIALIFLCLLVMCGAVSGIVTLTCRMPFPDSKEVSRRFLMPWSFCALLLVVVTCLTLWVCLVSDFFAWRDPPSPFSLFEVLSMTAYEICRALLGMLLIVITQVIMCHPVFSARVKILWTIFMISFLLIVVFVGCYMAREILQCGIVFCWGMATEGEGTGDGMGLRANEGLLATLVAMPLLIAHMLVLHRNLRSGDDTAPKIHDEEYKFRSHRTGTQRRRSLAAFVLACGIVPSLLLIVSALPNNFQKLHLKGGEENYRLPNQMAWVVDDAEVPCAWMKTINWRLSPGLVLKFYPDTILFYGFLEILAMTSLLAARFPTFGGYLRTRSALSCTIGEWLVLVLSLVLVILWVYYWGFQHWWGHVDWKFNEGCGIKSPVSSSTETVGRTLGMLSTLLLALLLLPASKNSLWLEAMGIGWERGIWAHRWLGAAMLISVVGHILAFWTRWHEMGIFPRELLYPSYYPLEPETQLDLNKPDGHNMTIYMMQLIMYPSLVLMGILPLLRRKYYELFKYLHYSFLIIIPAAVFLHAHNGWQTPIGGVLFWLVDAGIRLYSGALPVKLVTATAHEAEGGVTELCFEMNSERPGMYCWINVPQISFLQWHPFSLSSSPLDDHASMHIKNMGHGQFTDKLHALVHERPNKGPSTLTLNVDGPYGTPFELDGHGAVLLLAGGIGITPMHGTYRYLKQCADRQQLPEGLKIVRIVWLARTAELVEILKPSLEEVLAYGGLGPKFSASLCITKGSNNLCVSGATVTQGRPDFEQIVQTIEDDLGDDTSVLVKLCGPEAMAESAARATRYNKRVTYEPEIFIL